MAVKREFLTTNEVAQIIGLSPFTVRRYIQTRKLKAVKLEGSYRVRQSHLDDFIHAREIETEEELDAQESTPEPSTPRKAVTPIEKKRAIVSARTSTRKNKPRASTRRKEER